MTRWTRWVRALVAMAVIGAVGLVWAVTTAGFSGSVGGKPLARPVVGIARAPDGKGYREVASHGGRSSSGDVGAFRSVPDLPPPGPPRIALYGDSLGMEADPYFTYLAGRAGASTLVRTYGGLAVCDFLQDMATDAVSWKPTAVVLEFSGDNFTTCMDGDPIGSQQYYAKYKADLQTAIDIFRPYRTEVFVIGLPYDESAGLSRNVTNLDRLYQSVANANPGVTYIDAGRSVMANGAFTWSLPCLPYEACNGVDGTNAVRSPDGVHFCPTGDTTLEGYSEVCNVYSSGAFRFASAMLGPALNS